MIKARTSIKKAIGRGNERGDRPEVTYDHFHHPKRRVVSFSPNYIANTVRHARATHWYQLPAKAPANDHDFARLDKPQWPVAA